MSITSEEFASLSWRDQHFYLEHHNYVDCKVINGRLHVASPPDHSISWARFMELYNELPPYSYRPSAEGEILFYKNSDYTAWNKHGQKYIEYGFEYYLTINVSHSNHTREGQLAEKQLLTDWLLAHGGTEEELAAIQYNLSGFTAHFCCRFSEIPYMHIPEKMHKWLLKNPHLASCVYNDEAMAEAKKIAASRTRGTQDQHKQATFNF